VQKILKTLLKIQPNKTKLAKELYISRVALYGWLKGINVPKSKPVILRLKAVAKKYGVETE
jgi:hypothetical protein